VENRLEIGNCAATEPQFDDSLSFGTLEFRNGLEYHNSDFSGLIGNHLHVCTLSRSFVRFGTLTPEFKT